ncbi:MAG: MCE family protein [Haloechinothrix sp.]
MMTRATRIKLLVFGVIALVSVLYVGGKYAGLDRLLGSPGYPVTVELTDSGGIFVNSLVTYRGITVGRVTALNLTDAGVDVEVSISDDAPSIPADTTATVTNRSAVGEQYLDLRPTDAEGPYLEPGSVIGNDNTRIPISPFTMLSNVDKLVSSVNTGSVRTLVDESYEAFADVGPDLQKLLDTAHSFTISARENLPATRQLLSSARTVLETQQRHADDITTFSSGLKTIADQFAESDPDLRKIIDRAPKVSGQVSDFLATSGNDLGMLFANLLTTANITSARVDSLEQLMVNFAVVSAQARSVSDENSAGRLGVILTNAFDPPSCTKGYEGTKQRPADAVTEVEPNKQAYCAQPPGSQTGVRGAQNAPFGGKPVMVPPPGQRDQDEQTAPPGMESLPGVLGLPSEQRAPMDMAGLLGSGR